MNIFNRKKKKPKKDPLFIPLIMKAAKKEKEGSVASRIMLQFTQKVELRKAPPKKKPHIYAGHKQDMAAYNGTITLRNKGGIAGQAIATMKRDRILAERANR